MSRTRPAFFTEVQTAARKRWKQLESDRELAAPWRQLFLQVQSPRHVLSELLQNADDAGAKSVHVRIEDGVFLFSHDGADFNHEQFASLCKFGFSNKRNLHTIGFRGIGFKSTFSLGDTVRVITPSLSFEFHKERFTEPVWVKDAPTAADTTVAVAISNSHCEQELGKNLRDWAESPASLLFFRSIERLQIDDDVIEKRFVKDGPFSEARYVALGNQEPVLVIHSEEASFPEEAVQEIKAERFADVDSSSLPACRVEIVLGLPGDQRLYIVLPTGVTVDLPFSCNAPFLQDPGRFAIKDPATSPTNRWLLERVGKLAGASLRIWLNRPDLKVDQRAKAYELIPSLPCDSGTLESSCRDHVSQAFEEKIAGTSIVLTESGKLVKPGQCIAPPIELYSVWPSRTITKLFGQQGQSLLSDEVSSSSRASLSEWNLIEQIPVADVVRRLQSNDPLPRPESASQLIRLWAFVEENVVYDHSHFARKKMWIVPVEGSDVLHAAEKVVRKPMTRVLASPGAWNLVFRSLAVVDQTWVDLLENEDDSDDLTERDRSLRESAQSLLHAIGLSTPTSWDKLLTQVSLGLRKSRLVPIEDHVALAHIAAFVNVEVTRDFVFITRDGVERTQASCIVLDPKGEIEAIVPPAWAEEHMLHELYDQNFVECSREEWQRWCLSSKSGLRLGLPIEPVKPAEWWNSRHKLSDFLRRRGAKEPTAFPYKLDQFTAEDFDFPTALVCAWNDADSDSSLWYAVLRQLAQDPLQAWSRQAACVLYQVASSRRKELSGHIVGQYWIASQSLNNGGVEVPAEVWELTKQAPKVTGWVLEGMQKQPDHVTGMELLRRVEIEQSLQLYPAKYRIRETDS